MGAVAVELAGADAGDGGELVEGGGGAVGEGAQGGVVEDDVGGDGLGAGFVGAPLAEALEAVFGGGGEGDILWDRGGLGVRGRAQGRSYRAALRLRGKG